MGLSNRVQAILVGASAGLGAFGTAAAVIPDIVPVEYKVPITVTSLARRHRRLQLESSFRRKKCGLIISVILCRVSQGPFT